MNLRIGAMSAQARSGARKEKQAKWEKMGDGGSAPLPRIEGGGQQAPPTITGNDGFPCMSQGLVKSGSCRGNVGKRRRPRPINRHARPRPQAFRARGTPHLTFGFASKASPSAPWARGLLSVFWERGFPDLRACGPRRGYASRPVRPIFINKAFKTLARGQASRGGRRKTSSRVA